MTSTAPADRYRWDLDVLRILAILAVVSIHVNGLILGHPRLEGTATWRFALIVDKGVLWCVPIFVMISGALLLAPRAHARGTRDFYRRRLVRLLPALVIWHAVYIVIVRMWIFDRPVTWEQVVILLIDTKVWTALYFLWLILGLYAVAPILAAFLGDGGPRRAQWTAFVVMAWTSLMVSAPLVATQLGSPHFAGTTALTMWIGYVGLFVAGYAFREPQSTGLRWLWTGVAATTLSGLAVWQYATAADHPWLNALLPVGYTTPLVGAASICLFISLTDLCSRVAPPPPPPVAVRVLRALGEATFGVFLCHLLVVVAIQVNRPDFYADPAPVAKVAMYAVVVLVAFTVSLVARRVPVLRRVF